MDWDAVADRGARRYGDGRGRLPAEADARQKQLVRMAMAAGSVGLARVMQGRDDEARDWFARSAEAYRARWEGAPAGSWGRPIGLLKAHLLGGDVTAAVEAATWTIGLEPADLGSPIGIYAATLAELVLGHDEEAARLADALVDESGEGFPQATAAALSALAHHEAGRYREALADVVSSFEQRTDYLEDVPVADTVLVLETLAERRGMAIRPRSRLLPERLD